MGWSNWQRGGGGRLNSLHYVVGIEKAFLAATMLVSANQFGSAKYPKYQRERGKLTVIGFQTPNMSYRQTIKYPEGPTVPKEPTLKVILHCALCDRVE